MARDLGGDEGDAGDVGVAVFFREAESFGEVCADDIAIEERGLATVFEEARDKDLGGRGFAGGRKAGEPDADALLMPRRVALRENRRGLGPREPRRQRDAGGERVVAELRTGDGARLRAGGDARRFFVAVLIHDVDEVVERTR